MNVIQMRHTNSETKEAFHPLFLREIKYWASKKELGAVAWNHLITDDVRYFQTKSIWRLQPHTHAVITQNIYFKVWLGIKSGSSGDMEEDDFYGSESAGQLLLLAALFDL